MSQFHLTIASRGMFFFQDNSRYSLWSKVDNIGQHVILFMDSIIVLKRNPLRFCLRLCWRERMILWEGKDSRFGLFHFPPHRTRMTRPPAEGEEKTLSLDGNVEMFRKRIVDKSCKFKTHLTFSPDNTVGKGSFAILTMFLQWLTSPIIWQWRIRTATLWTCFVAQAVLKRKMAILAQSTTKSEVQACTNLQGLVLQVE